VLPKIRFFPDISQETLQEEWMTHWIESEKEELEILVKHVKSKMKQQILIFAVVHDWYYMNWSWYTQYISIMKTAVSLCTCYIVYIYI
jgi:hypothetical protein